MPVIRQEEYACNVPRLFLVNDCCAILKEAVYRGRLVAASEAALQHRIRKTLACFNTEVLQLHILMRGEGTRVRAAIRFSETYLFHK